MTTSFTIVNNKLRPILERYNFHIKEKDRWLTVGEPNSGNRCLYISSIIVETISIVEAVLPVFKKYRVSFSVVKDQLLINKLNGGGFGNDQVGQVITVFINSDTDIPPLIQELKAITKDFHGPAVPGCVRIGQVLYANGNLHNYCKFTIARKYNPTRTIRMLHWLVPIKPCLYESPKGAIFKAINTRKFAFSWCLVKKGNANAADDFQGRDIADRFLWQKAVLEDLYPTVPVPRFIDFFNYRNDPYLVTEYIEGTTIWYVIKGLLRNKPWHETEISIQITILRYYLQVLSIIAKMHDKGYTHRDITADNFIITKQDKIFVVDLELAYSYHAALPAPPFILGTPGYVSPEQIERLPPTVKEDIYSLGALLIYMLTGIHPKQLLTDERKNKRKQLAELIKNNELVSLALRCIASAPSGRPDLVELQNIVEGYLKARENGNHRAVHKSQPENIYPSLNTSKKAV